jgi:hypothetical protein
MSSQPHYTDKTHFFRDENDNRTVVFTRKLPDGSFEAELILTTGGALELLNLYGYGDTRLEAIADLREHIELETKQ